MYVHTSTHTHTQIYINYMHVLHAASPTLFLILPSWENHDPQRSHLKKASFCSKFKASPYWTHKTQFDATYVTYAPYAFLK